MTWTYSQKLGMILHNGKLEGTGYSGHGAGLNNGDMEAVRGVGPIPRGRYKIVQPWHDNPHLGKFVAALIPVGHDAHGRSGFYWHGDNPQANHTASDGCIVSPRGPREAQDASNDDDLEVVA